jgi:hypothetical protein
MESYTIIIVIILIWLFVIYKPNITGGKCNYSTDTIFDNMYFNVPILKTTEPESFTEQINDIQNIMPRKKYVEKNNNLQSSRWSGSKTSQPNVDHLGRIQHTNTDVQAGPLDLHHGIKNIDNAYKYNKHQFNEIIHNTHTEPFSDNLWEDASFSLNSKFT